jgi:tripartite-type tricarboxylate transporter receptor subunit TctC
MNNSSRRHFMRTASSALVLGAAGWPLASRAQPVIDSLKVLCGFGAGGGIDVVARRVGERMTGAYAKSVVVDNRAGAGGRLAIEALKAAPPDGSTLLLTPGAMLYIYPHIYRQLSYNPLTDLTPAAQAVNVPMAMGVGPMVPDSVKTVSDFLAWCKQNPSQASYGHGGAGSMPHFLGAMIERETGTKFSHVPYKGTQAAIQDMMGGQIAASTGTEADYIPHLKSGRLRLIGVASALRTRFNPGVPTFVEQGMKSVVAQEWFAFFLPPKTPSDIVQRTNASLSAAIRDRTTVESLGQLGFSTQVSTPAELGARLKADLETWRPIIQATGFTAD